MSENNFASGAKGQRFESSRAYQPPSENQQLTSGSGGPWAIPTACLTSDPVSFDQQLTSSPAVGQTVERDPRRDPRLGDVLRRKVGRNQSTAEVMYRGPLTQTSVDGAAWRLPDGDIRWLSLEYWQKTMRRAEVIHAVE